VQGVGISRKTGYKIFDREQRPECGKLGWLITIVAFRKMAHEATGIGELRFAFWAGICCAPALWLIFMLLWLLLIGGFRI